MRKYLTFFIIKFKAGFQYRIAALAGIVTQFFWGFMYLLLYKAFYAANPQSFPMNFDQLSSYIWLMQGLIMLVFIWFWDNDLFQAIENGNIAYELTRPVDIYKMWFAKILSARLSRTIMRFIPIILVASFLPKPYSLSLPPDILHFVLFIISIALGVGVLISFSLIIYASSFYTISAYGMKMYVAIIADFLAGGVLPLAFWPAAFRKAAELLPFSSIMNVPFMIYVGGIQLSKLPYYIGLQVFWFIVLIGIGRNLFSRCIKRVVVQGG